MKKTGSKNVEDILALTPMQEGMLFFYLKDPESDKNVEQLYVEISGKIDITFFRGAWDFVIRTNEMLRAVFRWEKITTPVQIILKEHRLNLRYVDLYGIVWDEKKKLLKSIREKDREERFDLHDVAFRVTLCKIEEDKYAMLISNHHILYDGWSSGIILSEFFKAYSDVCHKRIPLRPKKGRFRDFIHWRKGQDKTEIKREQEKFWRGYLDGYELRQEQVDFIKRKQGVLETGEYRLKFQVEVRQRIENFVKQQKVSLSSFFYMAWGLLLHGYNNCHDILFDTTASGRSVQAGNMENVVGLFINTLPLRVKAQSGEKTIDGLQRIHDMLTYREEFENTSRVIIKKLLDRYRGDVRFDSLVVIENYPLDIKSLEETNEFSIGSFSFVGMTDYDLTVILSIFKHMEVNFVYNKRLLSHPVVEKLSQHFNEIIKKIINKPGQQINKIRVNPGKVRQKKIPPESVHHPVPGKPNQKLLRGVQGGSFLEKSPPGRVLSLRARQGQIEQELIKIWTEILNRDEKYPLIDIDDNFLDLGGHSLSASMLTAAIHKKFNIKLPIGELFNLLTIRKIANHIMALKIERHKPILPVEKREFFPLSSAQKRIYILQRMDPDSVVYNGSLVVVIEGQINKNLLTRTFRKLVDRHESLRTSFLWLDGEPVQRIYDKVALNITRFQAIKYDKPEPVQGQELPGSVNRLILDSRKPFDLEKVPLLRVGLFEIETGRHILIVDVHHIISDGISRDILVKEFIALYSDRELPRLKLQYRDFSGWKNKQQGSGLIKQQEKYWLKKFSGELPVLNLPYDFPGPPGGSLEGERVRFYLEKQLTGNLKEYTRKTGTTVFMVLLAIYSILLGKYSGQTDIIIGTPTAGRNHTDLENIIGLVIDTIVTRIFPGEEKTAEKFLEEIKETTLEAYENQDYPFRELVKQVVTDKDLTGNPLFSVMLNVLEQNMDGWETRGLKITPFTVDYHVSWVDLTLEAVETRAGIMMEMEYCTRLFKRSTIEMLSRQFIGILEQVLKRPSITLAEIELFHPNREYFCFDDTDVKRKIKDQLLHELFEKAAKKYTDHTAVVHHDRQFTYGEVNKKGDQLALVLRSAGAKPGQIAALMVEPSVEMIIGIFGILKASVAYLPIDREYPQKRISFVLNDSKAKFLLVSPDTPGKVKTEFMKEHVKIIEISDTLFSSISTLTLPLTPNLTCPARPSDLAYVIYTSGSTGNPKGVLVEHRNAAAYLNTFKKIIKVSPEHVVLQQASFTFDTFIEEVFPILSTGGKIALADKFEVLDIHLLSRFISRYDVNIIDCSPLLLNELNQVSKQGKFHKHGCTFISGGDVLKKKYVDCLSNFGKVYNTYGPTETTVCATYYECAFSDEWEDDFPIGSPFPGYHVYVLDKHGDSLPGGLAGEIAISGTGVTRGYLNQPGLTAEKFCLRRPGGRFLKKLPPWTPRKNFLLFMTGDLGRRLIDGCFEFLGRIDRQVKIRGYRIELEEIEGKLLKFDGIKNTAAVVKENSSQGRFICAYFESDHDKNTRELRNFLTQFLPDYMIPAHFVRLEKLPVTVSGKIDREKLEETPWEPDSPGTVEKYIAPRDEIEKNMVDIWEDIFKKNKIGIDDHFFELGGDSLLAIRCINTIREKMKLEISLKEFFGQPSIRALSGMSAGKSQHSNKEERQQILKAPRNKPIPLSFSQERLWFLQKLDKQNMAYFVPRAIRIIGDLDANLIERTFTRLISRHEILRTVFPETDGKAMQQILDPFAFKIPVIDLTDMEEKNQDEEVFRWIREEGQREFDLETGPLLRVTMLKLKHKEHILVLTEHHLIHDGWTQGVLLQEFIVVFTAFLEGKPVLLPVLPIQYADFAYWQRDYLKGEILERHLDYWREKLSGLPPVFELPADRPRPQKISGNGAMKELVIPAPLTADLKKFGREQGVTLFMTMLTVFKVFLCRYTGVEDLCVGTGAANRRIKELEGMLGMVINTLALRTRVSAGLSFKECLKRVKQTCVEAFEHEETPFDRVVDAVRPERSLSYSPIFQVFFTFMDIPTGNLALPGLELVIEESHNRSAKFDVNIVVVPPQDHPGQEERNEILIEWEYNTDIFNDTTIDRMLCHYNRLLEETIRHPGECIGEISFLSGDEREQLLYLFNDTWAEYPADRKIHDFFEAQVERVPSHIAIIEPELHNTNCKSSALTYSELNKKSGEFSGFLKRKGMHSSAIVAIMMERSIEMVAGILGILKAGGAYLPIDPGYPEDRIRYILAESKAEFLVTDSKIDNNQLQPGNLKSEQTDLAYIIYTSGSTGKPKGVMVGHGSVVNILSALQKEYPLSESDKYLLKTSYVFDVSVTELFGWFFGWGSLVVMEEHGEKDPAKILTVVERDRVTHINFVPSMFNVFVDELNSHNINRLSCLKYIFLAGEVLLPELVNKFRSLNSRIIVENIYGPTEGTIYSSRYSLSGWKAGWRIPIGNPMQNTFIYILDSHNNIQPIGVPGELSISGAGTARGYLNNPELTLEKFVNYKLQNTNKGVGNQKLLRGVQGGSFLEKSPPGRRRQTLYKTGDLARWLEDGNIEFIGRKDHQVKIRGFRIELEEIENCLLNHEDIKESVVIVNSDKKKENNLCAYFVSAKELTVLALRDYLSRKLPAYMVPAYFFQVEKIPLTFSGKVNRGELISAGTVLGTGVEYVTAEGDIEKAITGIWRELLDVERVSIHDNFFDMGGNSFSLVRLNHRIKEELKIDIPIVTLFNHPTIALLSRYISQGEGQAVLDQVKNERTGKPLIGLEIGVIGMACRFPGARNTREFWENLKNGVESVVFRSRDELKAIALDPGILDNPDYVPVKGMLEDRHCFDAWFFGYTPAEAEIMDPQTRIFHECCWEALEDAGYDPGTYTGLIGLYAGATPNPYWEILPLKSAYTSGESFWESGMEKWEAVQFSGKDFLSTRIGYKLNLRGPCVALQTACSTSLAAVDLACQALLSEKCDIVLAGGVSITFLDDAGYLYHEGAVTSVDGHCRAFDVKARGTIGGDGAGVVVLKRLEEAVPDNDTIYGIIKGFAINNDGKLKAGFTAPSVEGQARVIREAHRRAGVKPGDIGYIEAHGTGTQLGDPIEIEGLKQAFRVPGFDKRNYCAVGSVKTNIGHLDAAAGIAGLIKAVLAIKHGLIPPSLHFEQSNPGFDLEQSPFYVNHRLSSWKDNSFPLRAGVSSFGLGGTNTHVVLEEAPPPAIVETGSFREHQLILLSAKTSAALERQTGNLVEYLRQNPGINLADVAYTLHVGRKLFPHRMMCVCLTNDIDEVIDAPGWGEIEVAAADEKKPGVIFMFSGQGSQYVNMGLDLYRTEPAFRSQVDRCFELLEDISGMEVKSVLYPGETEGELEEAKKRIHQFPYPQPIKFIFDYSLSILLMTWGIKPDAMLGYSLGEYVAACLSGVFSLEDALFIAFLRGRLIDKIPTGAMLGVPIPEEELKPLLTKKISLAAVNSESMCVVSGPVEDIDEFERELTAKGHECLRYRVSKAGHSWMMESILDEFRENLGRITFKKPQIPFVSGVTGDWIKLAEATDPGYWTWHLRKTVRFADALTTLLKEPNRVFLEVSPGRGLSLFLSQHPDRESFHRSFNLVRHQKEEVSDVHYILTQVGRLWQQGVSVDSKNFYLGRVHRRIPLPTYPFEREHYQPPKDILKTSIGEIDKKQESKKNPNIDEWFYVPLWERRPLSPGRTKKSDNIMKSFCRKRRVQGGEQRVFSKRAPLVAEGKEKKYILVFRDEQVGIQPEERLKQIGNEVITVTKGRSYKKLNDLLFEVNPGDYRDYNMLVSHLYSRLEDRFPREIIHLWGTGSPGNNVETKTGIMDNHLCTGFYSLVYLARELGGLDIDGDIHIDVVTCGVHEVTGQERLYPGKAAVLGALKVIPQEYPHLRCRHIDLDCPQNRRSQERLIDQLLTEILTQSEDLIVAYRNNYRWIQSVTPICLAKPDEEFSFLRQRGVYLLTGGLGRVGLILARHLAGRVQAKLVLTGTSEFPSRQEWKQWLVSHPDDDNISIRIKKIKEIEELGAEVLVFQAEVSDQGQMEEVLQRAEGKFGSINGVIHCAARLGREMYRAIKEIDEHDCREQFKPKVYGLLVLERLLGEREIDFCLLMSSGSSFLGGLGFAAYAAANNFMDAFVHYYKRFHPGRWISINWDVWQTGEESDRSASSDIGGPGASLSEFSLTPGEGAEVFERVLSWPDALQVINSTGDLAARIRRWIKLESLPDQDQPGNQEGSAKKNRPALSSVFVAPTNPVEQELAEIWQELLGYEPIGIQDNFFELGGDSLKAVIVTAKIHKALKIKIPIKDFFSQPFIAALARYIDNAGKSSYFPVKLVESKEYYSLSSVQKRLFILNQRDQQGTVYNIPTVMILEGSLDREKVNDTFRTLISRHESFRTAFELIEGEPVQRIYDEVEFEIEYVDPKIVREGISAPPGIINIIKEFVRSFDLSSTPLLRVGLIYLTSPPPTLTHTLTLTGHSSQKGIGDAAGNEGRYILMVDMHHSISDGTSMGIFVKEFMALYRGESLPLIKLQYKDFSEWQKSESGQDDFKQQQEYWLKQLEGEIPALNLPLDFPRPAVRGFAGRHVVLEPEPGETNALKELAGKEKTTLYMLLLSVYGILLSRLSGQEDILIGAPIAGRRHADSHQVIGMFVNTLVIRINPFGAKKYHTFLQQVKEQILAAFENQDYPFENLVELLAPFIETSSNHNPLFDAAFIFQNIEIPDIRVSGLKLSRFPFEHEVSRFDMMLVVKEVEEMLCFTFEYSTQLFRHETIQRWAGYFRQVLSEILHNPGLELSGIEILTRKEKRRILCHFNETAVDYPREKSVHNLFEEQVERAGDVTALHGSLEVWRNEKAQVTYRELDESADRLAHLIENKGVQADTIVGILANRSIELVVCILGILKSGAAYLPIDPGYPQEWINYVLADSGANLLLLSPGIQAKVKTGVEGVSFELIDIFNRISPSSLSLALSFTSDYRVNSTDLAYVIYTSGTTGKPKGVMVEHSSVVNTLTCRKEEYKMNHDDTSLQLFPYVFDGFVTSFFTPIVSGASVVLLSDEEIRDIEKIRQAVVKNQVTHLISVPSLYSAINESLTDEETLALKTVTLAGEKVSFSLLENILSGNQNLEIVNEYGVTESAVMSTIYRHQEKDNTIKIGHPIWNTGILIVDRYNRVQPVGVPGELCIGGVGLARGYLNNPELTFNKFQAVNKEIPSGEILDNFAEVKAADEPERTGEKKGTGKKNLIPYIYRIYRTGDLARWLQDGNIEFFGRMDHQVKIRGYRIEIGEIETRLSNHPEVKEVLVIDREDGNAEKYLCAYIVTLKETEVPNVNPETLREYLSQTLPVFMIPAYFVELENIPLTPSGKVDRKALPAPGMSAGEEYLPPGNEIEEQLVEIWSEVLNIDKEIIGVNDNFFDLGGNSLKVMQVNTLLKRSFGQEIPAVKMFRYPTIHSFADYISASASGNVSKELSYDNRKKPGRDRSGAREKGKSKLKNLKQQKKKYS